MQWLARYHTDNRYRPWLTVFILTSLTLVASFGITRLYIDPSNTQLFVRRSEAYQIYQQFRATFGSDETIVVALHHPETSLLSPAGIFAIRALTQALEAVPHTDSVTSITNVPDLSYLFSDPFTSPIPRLIKGDLSHEHLASLRDNPYVIGTLLSADLHTAVILVVPEATIAFGEGLTAWIAALRTVIARHALHGRRIYLAGTPIERHEVTQYLRRDQQLIVPLVFVLFLGITYSIYRVKRFALIPLGCVLLSLVWTLGLVGFAGVPLNLITSLLPPVIMVVSISVAIHVINHFIIALEDGARGMVAVQQAVCQAAIPCFLTSITTAMGFFSLLVSPVPAVQEFALFAGIGVLLSFIVTMFLTPLVLRYSGSVAPDRLARLQHGPIDHYLTWLLTWLPRHRRTIFVSTLLILAILLPGISRITEGTDIIRSLKQHAPLRISTEFIDQHVTGVNSVELWLQLPEAKPSAAFIRKVLVFSRWLRTQPGVTNVQSPWQPLLSAPEAILSQDNQLRLLATLLRLAFPVQSWSKGKSLRISVRVVAMRSDRFLALAKKILQQAQEFQLTVQVTGNNYLLAHMSHRLVQTQIRSLVVALVLVLGSITLALRSWKLGLVAAIANVLPPLMLFGFMGWGRFELSTATTMIASVALGLIVDDTIHLLYHYQRAKRTGMEISDAIERSLLYTGRALITTTLILTLGFWTGMLGSFTPTLHFSFLTGLIMLFALLADLILVPAVLLTWKPSNALPS